jgi:hypothetical protein
MAAASMAPLNRMPSTGNMQLQEGGGAGRGIRSERGSLLHREHAATRTRKRGGRLNQRQAACCGVAREAWKCSGCMLAGLGPAGALRRPPVGILRHPPCRDSP